MGAAVRLFCVLALLFGGSAEAAPRRIVSLDYCADQFVLGLADRSQIAALSIGAARDDSYFRARVAGLPRIRDGVEEVIARRPDLIVRNWGGGFDAAQTYARFGVPVLHVGDAPDFAATRADLLRAAAAFGQEARGRAIAADLDLRLARLRAAWPAQRPSVLYLTANGAAAGAGVLMNALIHEAGGRNARAESGWSVLPLERLMTHPPEIVAEGFFDTGQTRATPWSYAQNPALARALAPAKIARLPAGAISCEGWFAIDAAERLARIVNAP